MIALVAFLASAVVPLPAGSNNTLTYFFGSR
jgi:hypothetical protein